MLCSASRVQLAPPHPHPPPRCSAKCLKTPVEKNSSSSLDPFSMSFCFSGRFPKRFWSRGIEPRVESTVTPSIQWSTDLASPLSGWGVYCELGVRLLTRWANLLFCVPGETNALHPSTLLPFPGPPEFTFNNPSWTWGSWNPCNHL